MVAGRKRGTGKRSRNRTREGGRRIEKSGKGRGHEASQGRPEEERETEEAGD